MPPPFVKKTGQLIHYYYAKLVIGPSARLAGNYGFIIGRYKALESGEIQMSNYNRELWLKETEPQSTCAYCGGPGPLVADHVIPLAASGPEAMHNILRVCQDCNATKSDRDLIEWWDAVHSSRLGAAAESLPRLAAGIYLKLAYDWHKVQNTLESPAHELGDLRPFRTPGKEPRSRSAGSGPADRSRERYPHPSRPVETTVRIPATETHSSGTPAPPDTEGLILARYLYKEDLQELLEDLGEPTSGAKDELIERLRRHIRFNPKAALAFLDREELDDVCRQLGLPTGGLLRGPIEDRILAAILTERRTARR